MQNQRTRIKICGLTRADDVEWACRLGADSIGLVFHARSPRFIELQTARKIRQQIPAFVTLTALFSNESDDWIDQVIQQIQPDLLQFHGQETGEHCERWKLPYIKAVAMAEVDALQRDINSHPQAKGFLLDSHAAGQQGGSGHAFDWQLFPANSDRALILAGGLTPDNVAEAIQQTRPWGVDVSSGVESPTKGIKDANKMKRFVQEVKRVDCSQ